MKGRPKAIPLSAGLAAQYHWQLVEKMSGRVLMENQGPNLITDEGLRWLHGYYDQYSALFGGGNSITGNLIVGTLDPIWNPDPLLGLGIPPILPNPEPSRYSTFSGSGHLGDWRFRGPYIPWASLPAANPNICGGFWVGHGTIDSNEVPGGFASEQFFSQTETLPYSFTGRKWALVTGSNESHYYAKSRWNLANHFHPGIHGPSTHPSPQWRRMPLHTWSFGKRGLWENKSCVWYENGDPENDDPIQRNWVDYRDDEHGLIWNANNFTDAAGNLVTIDLDAENELRLRYDIHLHPPMEPRVIPDFPIARSDGTTSLHTLTIWPVNMDETAWTGALSTCGQWPSSRLAEVGWWNWDLWGAPTLKAADQNQNLTRLDPFGVVKTGFRTTFNGLINSGTGRSYLIEWDYGQMNRPLNAFMLWSSSSNPSTRHFRFCATFDPPITKTDEERLRISIDVGFGRDET